MKNLSLLILGLLFLAPGIAYSQTEEDRINFYDGVFFLDEEDYEESLAAFTKLYKGELKNNANINYLIGLCYLKIPGEKEKSIPYLEKAVTSISPAYVEGNFKEKNAPTQSLMLLADAYRITENLEKAVEYYNKFLATLDPKAVYEKELTGQQIAACKRAGESIARPYYLQRENIGNLYNSRFDNFNPVVSGNGSAVAFMSAQRFYDAVIFVEVNNGKWSNPVNITPQIQSDGDQYVTSLSNDGTTMYLSKLNVDDADIMISRYEARRWSKSENLGKPVNSKYFESHASISPDGKTLYFLSNRKESLGGMDIFKSVLDEKGNWSEPVNLGPGINTKLNEDSPVISSDGKSLYFSSQGHSTIGGYDIFVAGINADGTFSEPVPLPYPLNTTDDDLFFYPLPGGNSGYMARIEADGLGGEDIYLVKISEEAPVTEIVAEIEADETTEVTEVTENIEQADEVVDVSDEKEVAVVEPEKMTARYYIKPIFFAFDSYALDDISKGKLQDIKTLMDNFPELNLKVAGHTDSKGPDAYNQYLSEQRTKSVFNYLVSAGVDKARLELVAYGESMPAALNETADGKDSVKGRQLNRRVEFKISIKPGDMIIVEPVEVPSELKIK